MERRCSEREKKSGVGERGGEQVPTAMGIEVLLKWAQGMNSFSGAVPGLGMISRCFFFLGMLEQNLLSRSFTLFCFLKNLAEKTSRREIQQIHEQVGATGGAPKRHHRTEETGEGRGETTDERTVRRKWCCWCERKCCSKVWSTRKDSLFVQLRPEAAKGKV